MLEQYDEALAWARASAEQYKVEFWPHALSASALGHLGRADEANAVLEEAVRLNPDISAAFLKQLFSSYETTPAALVDLLAGLRKAGLPEK